MTGRMDPARWLLGLLCLSALTFMSYELREFFGRVFRWGFDIFTPMAWVLVIGGYGGWSWLGYLCLIRPGALGAGATFLVLVVGGIGAFGTLAVLPVADHERAAVASLSAGLWMANTLGVHRITVRIKRARAEANRDDPDIV